MARYVMDQVSALRTFIADVGVRYQVPARAFCVGQHNTDKRFNRLQTSYQFPDSYHDPERDSMLRYMHIPCVLVFRVGVTNRVL